MQRRKFLGLSSFAASVSLLPGLLSETWAHAAQVGSTHSGQTSGVRIPRWQPYDFPFPARQVPNNPFTVPLAAVVTGPNGQRFTVPGFFDGLGHWKVRFAPNTVGHWSLVTQSSLPELNYQQASFLCVANE